MIFPFINPERWDHSRYSWMSTNTQVAMFMLTLLYDLIVLLVAISVCVYLGVNGYLMYLFGFLIGYIGYAIARFGLKVRREYKEAHPSPIPSFSSIVNKKEDILNSSN